MQHIYSFHFHHQYHEEMKAINQVVYELCQTKFCIIADIVEKHMKLSKLFNQPVEPISPETFCFDFWPSFVSLKYKKLSLSSAVITVQWGT